MALSLPTYLTVIIIVDAIVLPKLITNMLNFSHPQLGKGFFVRRDILEHRWHELCLPEVYFLTYLDNFGK
jgi:hypothetical protein